MHTCDYNMYHFLQGSTIPVDECATATAALKAMSDNCSRAIQSILDSHGSLIDLYLDDCPTRLQAYASTCSALFGSDADEVSTYQGTQSCVSGQESCVVHKCVIYRNH